MMFESLYTLGLRPLLFQLDPETAHHCAMALLELANERPLALECLRSLSGEKKTRDPRLKRTVFGVDFPNPFGLAAGFDKNGIAINAWGALGFGFIEVGTVTSMAQPGNPPPRLFRFRAEKALINRMGFNNRGAHAMARRFQQLKDLKRWPSIPVGINLGKSKVTPLERAAEDYVTSFETLIPYGDYFVMNVSSPNTPGLRQLQNRAELDGLFSAVQGKNRELAVQTGCALKPLLVKIAPDLTFEQVEDVLTLIAEHGLAGIVATNTTIQRPSSIRSKESGGLSGRPLRAMSTEIVRFIRQKAPQLPIIAVGGIDSIESAKEKLDAGANLLQVYTGFVYEGPTLIPRLCRELS